MRWRLTDEAGHSITKWAYDDKGNVTEESFYNIYGKPCVHAFAGSTIRYSYDEHGALKEEAYFHFNGKPYVSYWAKERKKKAPTGD